MLIGFQIRKVCNVLYVMINVNKKRKEKIGRLEICSGIGHNFVWARRGLAGYLYSILNQFIRLSFSIFSLNRIAALIRAQEKLIKDLNCIHFNSCLH